MSEAKPFPAATPVQFSTDLLDSLDRTTESSFSRTQRKLHLESTTKSAELDAQLQAKRAQLANSIKSASTPENDNSAGSPELMNKLDTVAEKLKNSAQAKLSKSQELKDAEANVTKCLLNNKGKPLNCWDQVQLFKKLAGVP